MAIERSGVGGSGGTNRSYAAASRGERPRGKPTGPEVRAEDLPDDDEVDDQEDEVEGGEGAGQATPGKKPRKKQKHAGDFSPQLMLEKIAVVLDHLGMSNRDLDNAVGNPTNTFSRQFDKTIGASYSSIAKYAKKLRLSDRFLEATRIEDVPPSEWIDKSEEDDVELIDAIRTEVTLALMRYGCEDPGKARRLLEDAFRLSLLRMDGAEIWQACGEYLRRKEGEAFERGVKGRMGKGEKDEVGGESGEG